ncbi:hypothetical protein QZH41_011176 [Actinostola sp. cb2023]|nr:hypothetical protein QZH41_011176 [Actinostola sp. cb2023]
MVEWSVAIQGDFTDIAAGVLEVELYWRHAPKTCKNFLELSKRGYYVNCKFHRVIRNFMIQTGDPTGTGRGGASIYGKQLHSNLQFIVVHCYSPTFEDEITRDLKHTGAGVLSMANSGANTNGSQFFIILAPTQWLDGKHTIFGRIKKGMGVVKRIGLVETDAKDR